jgi:hypothetical protein
MGNIGYYRLHSSAAEMKKVGCNDFSLVVSDVSGHCADHASQIAGLDLVMVDKNKVLNAESSELFRDDSSSPA